MGRGERGEAAGPRRREERDLKAEGGLAGSHHFFRLELHRPPLQQSSASFRLIDDGPVSSRRLKSFEGFLTFSVRIPFRVPERKGAFSSKENLDRLIIKLTGNHEMNLLSLINPSSEVVYRSSTLSNHYIIRFIRFIS